MRWFIPKKENYRHRGNNLQTAVTYRHEFGDIHSRENNTQYWREVLSQEIGKKYSRHLSEIFPHEYGHESRSCRLVVPIYLCICEAITDIHSTRGNLKLSRRICGRACPTFSKWTPILSHHSHFMDIDFSFCFIPKIFCSWLGGDFSFAAVLKLTRFDILHPWRISLYFAFGIVLNFVPYLFLFFFYVTTAAVFVKLWATHFEA